MGKNESKILKDKTIKICKENHCPLNNVCVFELMGFILIYLKDPRNTKKANKDLVIGALI